MQPVYLELRQLRYFVAVADELNFTRAAVRLHMAQPPLSQQIRKFEDELGIALFDRTGGRVALTQAGMAILAEARTALAQAERVAAVARRVSEGTVGTLRIGFSSAAAHTILPPIVRAFRSDCPEVALALEEASTEEQLERLAGAALDAGFVRLPVESPPAGLKLKPVLREPLVLALPQGHALARRRTVPMRALAKTPLIRVPRHIAPGLYDQVTRMCARAGFTPNVVQEAQQIQTAIGLVAAGLGAAIVPASVQVMRPSRVVYRRLADAEITEIGVAWDRTNRSAALRRFLAVAARANCFPPQKGVAVAGARAGAGR
jgi:DNA-binding transcriptional LysR family regulator